MLVEQTHLTKNIFLRLFLLYFLTNIFLLLNFQGVYWDDWVLVSQQPKTIINIFTQTGLPLTGYLHVFLQKIGNGVYIYRIAVFFAYFFSGVFLFYILQRIKDFNKTSAFFITLLFLLAPVNDARVALANSTPIIFLFLFFLSFFLLVFYLENKGTKNLGSLRPFVLVLFFICFTVESFLVFYATALFYILYDIYQKKPKERKKLLCKQFIIKYPDFLCLPVLFFSLKHSFLKPKGLYVGYNSFSQDFSSFFSLLLQSFKTSLYFPVYTAISTSLNHLAITIAVSFLVIFTISRFITLALEKRPIVFWIKILLVGICLFVLAVIPYCAVGKLPQAENWGSRNQLLVPLGLTFILYSLTALTIFIHKKLPSLLMIGFVSAFIVQGLHSYYQYDMDWFYQVSLLEQFKQSKIIRENSTFIAKDNLEMDVWVNKRGLSFYEVNGLLKQAFTEDSRLVVHDISSIKDYQQYREHPQYNFSHWSSQPPVYMEFSKNKHFQLSRNKIFWLFYESVFNIRAFKRNIKNLTEITYLPPPETNSNMSAT